MQLPIPAGPCRCQHSHPCPTPIILCTPSVPGLPSAAAHSPPPPPACSFLLTLTCQTLPPPACSCPQAGTTDLLITHLPGFPDGITSSSDGNFWLSLIAPDQPLIRRLMPYCPLRWLMAWVTQLVTPKLKEWGMVVKVGVSAYRLCSTWLGPGEAGVGAQVASSCGAYAYLDWCTVLWLGRLHG